VPPGFTITTEVCTHYYASEKSYPDDLRSQVAAALAEVGRIAGKDFGDRENPLLVSVRSGGRASMPGMMDTVLNLGLNDATVAALARHSGDRRFAYDSYRRFITMYSDVVLGVEHHHFEDILDDHKDRNGYLLDTDLDADDWVELVALNGWKGHGAPFPQDRTNSCGGNKCRVRLVDEPARHHLSPPAQYPGELGHRGQCQAMVFGNMGETSATGVAFTRSLHRRKNTASSDPRARRDVVAGIHCRNHRGAGRSRLRQAVDGAGAADVQG
jgi:pyruvate,orthophosphate dikinase